VGSEINPLNNKFGALISEDSKPRSPPLIGGEQKGEINMANLETVTCPAPAGQTDSDEEHLALREAFRAAQELAAKWRQRQKELERRKAIAEIARYNAPS
jgi:hypothetical protein